VANLPGFPEKRFERNGIGQRAGGAVQPLGGGWRACPTAAVAWQVHAAGSRPQDPSEAAGSGPESSVLRASAGERRLKTSRRCRWSAWRPTPPGTRYRAPFMPPFCLCKVCASRPRRAASASGSTVEHASLARRTCLSGRGRRLRVVRSQATSHRHQAMVSPSRRGPPVCFERSQGLRGCIGQLH
jgi:hypothetical protein